MYDHVLLKLAVAVGTPLAVMACQLIVQTLYQLIHVGATRGKNRTGTQTMPLSQISGKTQDCLRLGNVVMHCCAESHRNGMSLQQRR